MRRLLNTLYVTNPEAYLRKQDDAIAVYLSDARVMSVPFHLLEGVLLFGHVGCSTYLLGACAQKGISTVLLDENGRFMARVEGPVSGNVLLRKEQYKRSFVPEHTLAIAKRFVLAKTHNARIVLQHYMRDYPDIRERGVGDTVAALSSCREEVLAAESLDVLRGIEGNAAHQYFGCFNQLIRRNEDRLRFEGRTKRPPLDPVNATLSLVYTLLSRDVASACESVGLDPQLGFLHACRPGRASLALDLIEELRAPVADRFVLSLFNRKQLGVGDFRREGVGCFLTDKGLKDVVRLWQERKKETVLHPYLEEKVPYGLIPFVQAQLFARFLRGDLDDYPAMLWR